MLCQIPSLNSDCIANNYIQKTLKNDAGNILYYLQDIKKACLKIISFY